MSFLYIVHFRCALGRPSYQSSSKTKEALRYIEMYNLKLRNYFNLISDRFFVLRKLNKMILIKVRITSANYTAFSLSRN